MDNGRSYSSLVDLLEYLNDVPCSCGQEVGLDRYPEYQEAIYLAKHYDSKLQEALCLVDRIQDRLRIWLRG